MFRDHCYGLAVSYSVRRKCILDHERWFVALADWLKLTSFVEVILNSDIKNDLQYIGFLRWNPPNYDARFLIFALNSEKWEHLPRILWQMPAPALQVCFDRFRLFQIEFKFQHFFWFCFHFQYPFLIDLIIRWFICIVIQEHPCINELVMQVTFVFRNFMLLIS